MIDDLKDEARRLEAAREAMDAFCHELSQLSGRVDEEDELTAQIYAAVAKARKKGTEFEEPTRDQTPAWVRESADILRSLWGDKLYPVYIAEIVRGDYPKPETDYRLAVNRSRRYFRGYRVTIESVTLLAACLHAHAFGDRSEALAPRPDSLLGACLHAQTLRNTDEALVPRSGTPMLVDERQSLTHLGQSVRVGGTVLAGIGLILTGAVWLIPMVAVFWLMAWCLTDRRAVQSYGAPLEPPSPEDG